MMILYLSYITYEDPLSSPPQIREDIAHHKINIYPAAYGAEDEEDAAINSKIDVSIKLYDHICRPLADMKFNF